MKPQDVVLAIDSKQLRGLSLYEAAELLQGEAGSSVTLTLQPKGQRSSTDKTLVRCARLHLLTQTGTSGCKLLQACSTHAPIAHPLRRCTLIQTAQIDLAR